MLLSQAAQAEIPLPNQAAEEILLLLLAIIFVHKGYNQCMQATLDFTTSSRVEAQQIHLNGL
jgi:hypothetical protein